MSILSQAGKSFSIKFWNAFNKKLYITIIGTIFLHSLIKPPYFPEHLRIREPTISCCHLSLDSKSNASTNNRLFYKKKTDVNRFLFSSKSPNFPSIQVGDYVNSLAWKEWLSALEHIGRNILGEFATESVPSRRTYSGNLFKLKLSDAGGDDRQWVGEILLAIYWVVSRLRTEEVLVRTCMN